MNFLCMKLVAKASFRVVSSSCQHLDRLVCSHKSTSQQVVCMRTFDCIEGPLSRLFYRYGQYVALHPLPFIAVPILITAFCSISLLHIHPVADPIYLFTPRNAPSKYERQVIHNLWPLHYNNYIPGRAVTQSREVQVLFPVEERGTSVIVASRDGGNILEQPYAEAVRRLDFFIQNRVRLYYMGKTYRYHDLCLQWRNEGCPGNKHVHIVSDLYQHGINITYPTVRFGSASGYIGGALGGVSLFHEANGTVSLAGGLAWFMIYHLKFFPNNISYISGLWEKKLQEALERYPPDPSITFTYLHSQTLTEELKRNANSLIPRFVVAFSILVFFSILCSLVFVDGTFYIDWVLSKPVLSLLGVINAAMGIVTGIGITSFCGVPCSDIVGVMPFLLVAVGTDNMFLMVAAVRHTNRAYPVPKRIGESMSDAAISILITSLTDAFSFGVGAITCIPAVQIFCIYTGVAITVTFIYQVSFFCALLSLAVEWEAAGLHCVWLQPTISDTFIKSISVKSRLFWMGSRADPDAKNLEQNLKDTCAKTFFKEWFAPVLMNPVVKILVAMWFFIYAGLSVYGCFHLREGLEPINLLVQDSYAIPHYRYLEKYFWNYGAPLQIVVNNAPDLRDTSERRRVQSMVHAFANTKYSIGDDSVQFWLNEMEIYYKKELGMDIVDSEIYGMAEHFFLAKSQDIWSEDVIWETNQQGFYRIRSFRFLVGMKHISKTYYQEEATRVFREVAQRYPSYNVTTFSPLWLFTDQYAIVISNTIQNILIALVVMIVIAMLLIPQPLCSLWVAFAIASIDLGVIGFMTLWDVNLDAISMITIIMSIGFSVDYSAHVTYGYVISAEPTPEERVRTALGALGWPVTQGAMSTILAVVVLADIPAYMITVFLSIVLGLLHGLIFLPVMLSWFVGGSCVVPSTDEKTKNSAEEQSRREGSPKASITTRPNGIREVMGTMVQPYGPYGIYLSRNPPARRSYSRQINSPLNYINPLRVIPRRLGEATSNPF
uniref:SSD domain-containing protein n=1 Tax=Setaria digitata TaxID=48799 RepID=A0A915PT93_9BILA